MVLRHSSPAPAETLAARIAEHIASVLRSPCVLRKMASRDGLPSFIPETYGLYETEVLGRRCALMVADNAPFDVAALGKHAAIVGARLATVAIVVLPSLDSRRRRRLVAAGVPFLVPGNQFFVPALAMDFNECFTPPKAEPRARLSPTAQMVVLSAVLDGPSWTGTTRKLSARLGVAPMSAIRAFDEVEKLGLAHGERHGRERGIRFVALGRDLFQRCLPMMRDPVLTVREVSGLPSLPRLPASGEHALSTLTDLSPPRVPTLAVHSRALRAFEAGADRVPHVDDPFLLESWIYDPVRLGGESIVDPLSLFLRFRDHPDERVSLAADSLLERFAW